MKTMPNTTSTPASSAANNTGAANSPASANATATASASGDNAGIPPLADINGLRLSGIFPRGKEPSIRTLREWTKRRRIPFHRLGHFVYFDIAEVARHIRVKLLIPARN